MQGSSTGGVVAVQRRERQVQLGRLVARAGGELDGDVRLAEGEEHMKRLRSALRHLQVHVLLGPARVQKQKKMTFVRN